MAKKQSKGEPMVNAQLTTNGQNGEESVHIEAKDSGK